MHRKASTRTFGAHGGYFIPKVVAVWHIHAKGKKNMSISVTIGRHMVHCVAHISKELTEYLSAMFIGNYSLSKRMWEFMTRNIAISCVSRGCSGTLRLEKSPCRWNHWQTNVTHVPLLSIFYPHIFLLLLFVPISHKRNCEKIALWQATNGFNRHCDVTNCVRLFCLYLHHMPTSSAIGCNLISRTTFSFIESDLFIKLLYKWNFCSSSLPLQLGNMNCNQCHSSNMKSVVTSYFGNTKAFVYRTDRVLVKHGIKQLFF